MGNKDDIPPRGSKRREEWDRRHHPKKEITPLTQEEAERFLAVLEKNRGLIKQIAKKEGYLESNKAAEGRAKLTEWIKGKRK